MERNRSLEERVPPRMLSLMTSMYLTQYLGIGFVFIGATTILRSAGMGLDKLSLLTATGLFWAIKFLWAPLLDRYGSKKFGHYRGWILAFQTGMVAVLLVMATITPTLDNYGLVLALTSIFVLCSATQDIAADGLVLVTLPRRKHGIAGAIQIAAGYLGNVIGGGAVLVVYQYAGWAAAMYLLAGLTAITIAQVLWSPSYIREAKPAETNLPRAYKSLGTLLKKPDIRRWALVLLPSTYVASSVIYFLLTPTLTDLGWSPAKIGITLGVITGIPATLGALGAGWLIQRCGLRLPVVVGGTITCLATVALIPAFNGHDHTVLTTLGASLYMGGYAIFGAAIYTVNMRYCRKDSPASDFTVLNCIGMCLSFVGGAISLSIAEHAGYTPVALGATVLLIVGTFFTLKHIKHGNFQKLALDNNN